MTTASAQRETAAQLVAHSPGATGAWHSLADHLASTGSMCGDFTAHFGSRLAGELVGNVHDLGKADPEWQRYLHAVAAGGTSPTVDHKTAGAQLLAQWRLGVLAPLVLGHHGGLKNAVDVRARLGHPQTHGQCVALGRASELGLRPPIKLDAVLPSWAKPTSTADRTGFRRQELWMRMVFSALIDADRLDTASFLHASRPAGLANHSVAQATRRSKALVAARSAPAVPTPSPRGGRGCSRRSSRMRSSPQAGSS